MTKDLRAELRDWYLARLRPKLERAAGDGTVPPAAVEALERQMEDFLGLEEPDEEEAA
jgi:hypothetical protein